MNSKLLVKTPAQKFMDQALVEQIKFVSRFQEMKAGAFNAGWYLTQAKQSLPHGMWEEFISQYQSKISSRTARLWMEFSEEVIFWVKSSHPESTKEKEILALAHQQILQSPKSFVNLCRELGQMRKFGEYDEVAYAKRKVLGQAEFIFGYETCVNQLQALCKSDRITELHPRSLLNLKTELEAGLKHVNGLLNTVDIKS